MTTHVVYKIVDTRDDTIVCIGSGTVSRPRSSLVTSNHAWIRNNKNHLDLKVSDRLSEEVARYLEMKFIDKYRPRFNKVLHFLPRPKGTFGASLKFHNTINFKTQQQLEESRIAVIEGQKSGTALVKLVRSPERLLLDRKLLNLHVYISRALKARDLGNVSKLENARDALKKRINTIEAKDNPGMTMKNGRMVRANVAKEAL